MTLDDIITEISRGICSRHRLAHNGCAQCGVRYEAIEAVRVRFALPVIRACGDCVHCVEASDGLNLCHHEDAICNGERFQQHDSPPSWCPLRRAT
jgi:hydrogenase maturation factor HypF (carbamoyltransferase family)